MNDGAVRCRRHNAVVIVAGRPSKGVEKFILIRRVPLASGDMVRPIGNSERLFLLTAITTGRRATDGNDASSSPPSPPQDMQLHQSRSQPLQQQQQLEIPSLGGIENADRSETWDSVITSRPVYLLTPVSVCLAIGNEYGNTIGDGWYATSITGHIRIIRTRKLLKIGNSTYVKFHIILDLITV